MRVSDLVALVAFTLVSSITPGPNNLLLWASGAQFGFRRTVPHIAGTSLGMGSITAGSALGVGVLVTALPAAQVALKVAGSAYLLYLAWRIAAGGALRRPVVARPLSVGQAAIFQWFNPKAWIFALAAVSAFRPAGIPVAAGSAVVVAAAMIVILPSATTWAAAGTVISRLVTGDRAIRALSAVLATVLVASVVDLWV
jgi:threonine/homoserine/homoserine lactone efflux protein